MGSAADDPLAIVRKPIGTTSHDAAAEGGIPVTVVDMGGGEAAGRWGDDGGGIDDACC